MVKVTAWGRIPLELDRGRRPRSIRRRRRSGSCRGRGRGDNEARGLPPGASERHVEGFVGLDRRVAGDEDGIRFDVSPMPKRTLPLGKAPAGVIPLKSVGVDRIGGTGGDACS